ncbi:MAG: CopG family antitoxin [Candidatus Absconditabacteria bacterium]|nr:CopG family antitoxin [Candidatus Absconditabacteria bacterium]
MKKNNLTSEEKKINKDISKGKYVPVKNFEKEKKVLQQYVKEYRSLISLRVPQKNLDKLKILAKKEGIPYQTLINSILHKYVVSN